MDVNHTRRFIRRHSKQWHPYQDAAGPRKQLFGRTVSGGHGDVADLANITTNDVPFADLSLRDFDGDEDDWYVMHRADQQGLNALDVLRDVRTAQKQAARVRAIVDGGRPVAANVPPVTPPGSSLAFPPGFAGALAQFIYQAAPRPVAEVAVVGALGLLAGVCGREWCIPGSGLNIYVVLIARSAIGKEAMHQGISKLVAAARAQFPGAGEFVCFDDFASGPALVKYLINAPCSVNVAGEIGHKFSAMANDKETAMRSLRRTMTNLYSKSGRDNVAGGIVYSNAESSVASTEGVAYSLIGESTPGTFFESITRGMMEDGFMSRFNVVEYTGDRPDKNPGRVDVPDPAIVAHLVALMTQAHTLRHRNLFQDVAFSPAAAVVLSDFERECDAAIRAAGDDESRRQMWNRAHLKVLRIAALLAVGDNHLHPSVRDDHAAWAISLVRADVAVFGKRIGNGDVGDGSDDGREGRIIELCRDYIQMKPEEVPNYAKKWESARAAGVVPRSYLQMKTQRLSAFEKHPRGHKFALDTALQTAIDNGRLFVMSPATAASSHKLSFQGKLYGVLDLTSHRGG